METCQPIKRLKDKKMMKMDAAVSFDTLLKCISEHGVLSHKTLILITYFWRKCREDMLTGGGGGGCSVRNLW